MIFTVPKSKYTDFYDIARYNLTWRITIIVLFFLPTLAITLFLLGEEVFLTSTIASIISAMVLVILRVTRSYTFSAIIFSVLGVLINIWALNFYTESYHFVDTMWIMVIVLYTYFTFGKLWGTTSLIISLAGIVYYILFVLRVNLLEVKQLMVADLISHSINFIISAIIIAYLINQFIQTSKYAESKYKSLTTKLQENNQEKTILLKEIHHRVKNNLQVITSLLRLQSREITDDKSKVIYEESINRVIAMSLIHEKIYQTKNVSKIDLEEYINSLAEELLITYSVNGIVGVNVESNVESINTKSLVPIAIIFNELISNSLKYAFTKNEIGKISISIINKKNNQIEVIYKDNGTWKQSIKDNSFGLELIDTLTEQLSGSYTRETTIGTIYRFNFMLTDNN